MNTSISTKLASIALALVANSLIMGSVAFMFKAGLVEPTSVASVASTASTASAVSAVSNSNAAV